MLFCKQYFSVDLLRYYANASAFLWKIIFRRPVTLLRYYERFSVNNIFQSTCYGITLMRALFFEKLFSVDLLRYYAITNAFL